MPTYTHWQGLKGEKHTNYKTVCYSAVFGWLDKENIILYQSTDTENAVSGRNSDNGHTSWLNMSDQAKFAKYLKAAGFVFTYEVTKFAFDPASPVKSRAHAYTILAGRNSVPMYKLLLTVLRWAVAYPECVHAWFRLVEESGTKLDDQLAVFNLMLAANYAMGCRDTAHNFCDNRMIRPFTEDEFATFADRKQLKNSWLTEQLHYFDDTPTPEGIDKILKKPGAYAKYNELVLKAQVNINTVRVAKKEALRKAMGL